MKTLNNFLSNEQNVQILSVNELVAVRGGEIPPEDPGDPFKKLPKKKPQVI
jgi:hypothetical protein